MNYYKHHIGDYDAATSHLSMLEDAAYRRLLCLYYRKEQPIPPDIVQACRLVRASSKDERAAVEAVLAEFFDKTADGWRHGRCDQELAAAAEAAERNRKNGRNGGRPVKSGNPDETQQKPSGLSVGTHDDAGPLQSGNLSHKPLATSHEEAKIFPSSTGGKAPPEPDPIFGVGLAFLVSKGVPEKHARSWLGLFRKDCGADIVASELLTKAAQQDVSDPIAWLTKAVKARAAPQLSLVPTAPEPRRPSDKPLTL